MPKKPEENVAPEAPKKPTHGPKPEKPTPLHLREEQKPGEVSNPTTVITHKHERKETVERDCTQCEYAVQVSDNEWECSAETYFPRSLLCFRPHKTRKE